MQPYIPAMVGFEIACETGILGLLSYLTVCVLSLLKDGKLYQETDFQYLLLFF